MNVNKKNGLTINYKKHHLKNGKFDIVKVKKEMTSITDFEEKKIFLGQRRVEYLQEVEKNENAHFIKAIDLEFDFMRKHRNYYENKLNYKRIAFKGSSKQLTYYFHQLRELRDKDGQPLFKGTILTFSRLISKICCRADGSSFNEDTMRRYLTGYSNGELKSPKKK